MIKRRLITTLVGVAFSGLLVPRVWAGGENPMWRFGLVWECRFEQIISCERSRACNASVDSGAVFIDFPKNQVKGVGGDFKKIRRHYEQSVVGSPIVTEVKIETENNEAVWLQPVDGSGMFSDNWLGVLVTPTSGVVVSEMRPLICTPTKAS